MLINETPIRGVVAEYLIKSLCAPLCSGLVSYLIAVLGPTSVRVIAHRSVPLSKIPKSSLYGTASTNGPGIEQSTVGQARRHCIVHCG